MSHFVETKDVVLADAHVTEEIPGRKSLLATILFPSVVIGFMRQVALADLLLEFAKVTPALIVL